MGQAYHAIHRSLQQQAHPAAHHHTATSDLDAAEEAREIESRRAFEMEMRAGYRNSARLSSKDIGNSADLPDLESGSQQQDGNTDGTSVTSHHFLKKDSDAFVPLEKHEIIEKGYLPAAGMHSTSNLTQSANATHDVHNATSNSTVNHSNSNSSTPSGGHAAGFHGMRIVGADVHANTALGLPSPHNSKSSAPLKYEEIALDNV